MNAAGVNLGHTPGLYYALAYWISALIFLAVNRRRFDNRRQGWLSALFLLALAAFMYWTDGVTGWLFVVSMLTILSLIFLFFWLSAYVPALNALYFSLRIFILGEFAASLEWQLFYYGLTALGFPLSMGVNALFLLLVHPVVFGCTYLLERRCRESNESMSLSYREIAVIVLCSLLVFLLSNISFALPESPFSSSIVLNIFAIRTLTDFGGAALLLALHMQICESNVRMEKDYLRKLLHMQKENYRLSAESVELVNRKYHDLKHQIQLLRSEISAGDKLRYLDEMEHEIQSYEAQNKTGNKVLDTLLTAKSLKCQSLGISLTCVADGKELDFIKPTDLSVLFGNALDNAMESAAKLSDSDKRLIHLSVARQKRFLRIRVENCYEGEIRFVDGLPATGKDARYHGYGMKSIRSIVEKYGGSMTVKVQDGWFELRILIPIADPPAA